MTHVIYVNGILNYIAAKLIMRDYKLIYKENFSYDQEKFLFLLKAFLCRAS